MKRILSIFLFIFCGAAANAGSSATSIEKPAGAIAGGIDHFKCQLHVVSNDGAVNSTHDIDFSIAREPADPFPSTGTGPTAPKDMRYTFAVQSADFVYPTNKGDLTVKIGIGYAHAFRVDANEVPLKAGQNGCFGIDYLGPDGNHISLCKGFVLDEADPLNGYTPVDITNGVPDFDLTMLTPASQILTGFGTAEAHCIYTDRTN